MTGRITAGSILVREGTHLPNGLRLQSESHLNGWVAASDTRSAFEETIRGAGWTFFFMAGEIKATVFGLDRQKALRAALKRLTKDVESQQCNSIEITRVADKSFLGFPYTSVSVHARHAQKGNLFPRRRGGL